MNASFSEQFRMIEETITSKRKKRTTGFKEWEYFILYICAKHSGNTNEYFPTNSKEEFRNLKYQKLLLKMEKRYINALNSIKHLKSI